MNTQPTMEQQEEHDTPDEVNDEERAAELISIFYEVRKRLHEDCFPQLSLNFPIKESTKPQYMGW